jgi:hypothetical protein
LVWFKLCGTGGHTSGGATSSSKLTTTALSPYWTSASPPYRNIIGWAKLLGFDFTVEYKPGCQNIIADTLSRRDVPTSDAYAITGPSFDLFDSVRQAAHIDPVLVTFQEKLESGKLGILGLSSMALLPSNSGIMCHLPRH